MPLGRSWLSSARALLTGAVAAAVIRIRNRRLRYEQQFTDREGGRGTFSHERVRIDRTASGGDRFDAATLCRRRSSICRLHARERVRRRVRGRELATTARTSHRLDVGPTDL